MAPKKGENTKKAAGNAKKAEAAAEKAAVANARAERAESDKWQQGAKDDSKKTAAADKAAEAQRKRDEKAAMLADEEANMPDKPKGAGKKTAAKKSKGLDLSMLEASGAPELSKKKPALNATGIDDALDALSLANNKGANDKVEMHPERRFKAAYAAYEERRLEEMKDEKGLRRQQKIERIRKEFEKSPENPFNQALVGTFGMSKDEKRELVQKEREGVEERLTQPQPQPDQ
ncbi:MAG: hypothetical protein Q9162_000461 [Coniocarpon cinnabarinum]